MNIKTKLSKAANVFYTNILGAPSIVVFVFNSRFIIFDTEFVIKV